MGPQILHYFYIKYLTENWLMVAQTLPYFIVNVFVNWKLVNGVPKPLLLLQLSLIENWLMVFQTLSYCYRFRLPPILAELELTENWLMGSQIHP